MVPGINKVQGSPPGCVYVGEGGPQTIIFQLFSYSLEGFTLLYWLKLIVDPASCKPVVIFPHRPPFPHSNLPSPSRALYYAKTTTHAGMNMTPPTTGTNVRQTCLPPLLPGESTPRGYARIYVFLRSPSLSVATCLSLLRPPPVCTTAAALQHVTYPAFHACFRHVYSSSSSSSVYCAHSTYV